MLDQLISGRKFRLSILNVDDENVGVGENDQEGHLQTHLYSDVLSILRKGDEGVILLLLY